MSGKDRTQPPDPCSRLAARLQRTKQLVAPVRGLLPLPFVIGLAEAQVLREAAGYAPVARLLGHPRVGMEEHGKPVGVPVGQRLDRRFRGAADFLQQVGQRDRRTRQSVPRQKKRLVDDPVGGKPVERGIEARPQSLGQPRLPVRVTQRDVKDVMGGEADLFGKAQRREPRPVDDRVAHGPSGPLPVPVPTPQRQDGERGVGLAQMGESAGGAGGVGCHRPAASRSRA